MDPPPAAAGRRRWRGLGLRPRAAAERRRRRPPLPLPQGDGLPVPHPRRAAGGNPLRGGRASERPCRHAQPGRGRGVDGAPPRPRAGAVPLPCGLGGGCRGRRGPVPPAGPRRRLGLPGLPAGTVVRRRRRCAGPAAQRRNHRWRLRVGRLAAKGARLRTAHPDHGGGRDGQGGEPDARSARRGSRCVPRWRQSAQARGQARGGG
mmetsp:Transcript_5827/g.24527  ORF Transcript_5827/g.24527 Transcript_5827/m.24527 type:complete len:205 (+) Transcript_5827:718-1332(+)